MSKKARFPLIMKDGIEVRDIEELKEFILEENKEKCKAEVGVRNIGWSDYEAMRSTDFYKQIEQLVDDLKELVDEYLEVKSFGEEVGNDIELKKLDTLNNMIDELNMYHSVIDEILEECRDKSRRFDYETKLKAKMACKEAIESVIHQVDEKCREAQNILRNCQEVLFGLYEKIVREAIEDFSNKFCNSYEDYVSVDCWGQAKEYALNMKEQIIGKKEMDKLYNDLNFKDRLRYIEEDESKKFFSRLLDVQKYFGMCTYERRRGSWCYDIDDAMEQLDNYATEYVEWINGFFPMDKDKKAWFFDSVIDDYSSNLKNSLEGLLQETNMWVFMQDNKISERILTLG